MPTKVWSYFSTAPVMMKERNLRQVLLVEGQPDRPYHAGAVFRPKVGEPWRIATPAGDDRRYESVEDAKLDVLRLRIAELDQEIAIRERERVATAMALDLAEQQP